ncbi:MAG: hypothetical protein FWE85_00730, partial [Clostridiales bacterium]|nr:hypothetical protein [Clostridiales bacterium]
CFDSAILYDEDLIEVTCPACGAVVFVNGDDDENDGEVIEIEEEPISFVEEKKAKAKKSKKDKE